MKISVFGLGYVGCISLGCLAESGHQIIGVDVSGEKVDLINSGKPTIIEAKIGGIIEKMHRQDRIAATLDAKQAVLNSCVSLVCVGTPSSTTGHLNLDYVMTVAGQLGEALREKDEFHTIAVRSTVLPGTVARIEQIIEEKSGKRRDVDFAVACNPEFLREGSAVADYYNPPFTLVGCNSQRGIKVLRDMYSSLGTEFIGEPTNVVEIIKYVNNAFHALKISFANEIGNICQSLSIDSHKVMDIIVQDTRLNISPCYLKPGFAYGGSCLPKDLLALRTLAHDHYIEVPVIENISRSNGLQVRKAVELMTSRKSRKIGFLGISFKAGTDDLRNSPTVDLVETLLGKGFDIAIYDKNILLAQLTGTNKEYIQSRIPHLSRLMVDSVEKLLEMSETVVIGTKEDELAMQLHSLNGHHEIIDLVRLDDSLLTKGNYHGICW